MGNQMRQKDEDDGGTWLIFSTSSASLSAFSIILLIMPKKLSLIPMSSFAEHLKYIRLYYWTILMISSSEIFCSRSLLHPTR